MKNKTIETDQPLFKTTDGAAFDVPVEGSLGLLAYGDIGLMAWRHKKLEAQEERQAAAINESEINTPLVG